MSHMKPGIGVLCQQDITGNCNVLCYRRTPLEPQHGAAVSLVHDTLGAECGFLLMVDDNLVKAMEIVKGVQHDLGRRIEMAVIGKGHRPCLEHISHLCQFFPLLAFGNCTDKLDMDKPRFSGSFLQAADKGRRIHHRFGIWHSSYAGEATCSSSLGAGDKVLFCLLPWLTEVDMHINEAGSYHFAGSIVDLCALCLQVLAYGGNLAILNQHICHLVEFILRIDDPAALQ